MSTFSPPRHDQDQPARHGSSRRWVLAAVAAVVAIGGLLGLSALGSDEVRGVDEGGAGVAVAEVEEGVAEAEVDAGTALVHAYLSARNAYDVEQAKGLVSEDFSTTEVPGAFRDLATMELAFATHEAYGFQYTEPDCDDPTPGPQGVVFVHCSALWDSELQAITGYPPVSVSFTFRVEDDRITRVAHRWNGAEFAPNVYDPWIAFLTEHHPEFARLVLAFHRLDPELTPEGIRQMPEHLERYEEWVATGSS
jgi:ketosteroid isomerase-like protein